MARGSIPSTTHQTAHGEQVCVKGNRKSGQTNTAFESQRRGLKITQSGVKNAGKKKPVVECPHCKKIGSVNTMSRWHFANCKQKKDGE